MSLLWYLLLWGVPAALPLAMKKISLPFLGLALGLAGLGRAWSIAAVVLSLVPIELAHAVQVFTSTAVGTILLLFVVSRLHRSCAGQRTRENSSTVLDRTERKLEHALAPIDLSDQPSKHRNIKDLAIRLSAEPSKVVGLCTGVMTTTILAANLAPYENSVAIILWSMVR